jgi:hypothetical protein
VWSVDGEVAASTPTFVFSSTQTGMHTISLTVVSEGVVFTDQITITVYHLIDFESSQISNYLAGPTSYGENLYSDFGAGQYIGYADASSGLKMMLNEAPDWMTGELSREFWNGGIAISQWDNMTTAGYLNQCSVYYKDAATGFGGYKGSKTFAVNNSNGEISFADGATEATFYYFWVTNSTYAALSMKNGDDYAKQFTYEENDWFKLIINAYDKNNNPTGTPVEFYLADFRTATSPGILTQWSKVDLTPLGNNVHTLAFDFDSSDASPWGVNTPTYFCFDNIAFQKK